MKVILAYDVEAKRIQKVHDIVEKYLFQVQNSLFEGNISEKTLERAKKEIMRTIDVDCDHVIIYKLNASDSLSVDELGCPKFHSSKTII